MGHPKLCSPLSLSLFTLKMGSLTGACGLLSQAQVCKSPGLPQR